MRRRWMISSMIVWAVATALFIVIIFAGEDAASLWNLFWIVPFAGSWVGLVFMPWYRLGQLTPMKREEAEVLSRAIDRRQRRLDKDRHLVAVLTKNAPE